MGHMSMRHRGARIQCTVRLPVDEYREVAVRARTRGWSMSDYIGWCVAKELSPRNRRDPLGLGNDMALAHPPLGETRDGNRAPYVPVRDFDG